MSKKSDAVYSQIVRFLKARGFKILENKALPVDNWHELIAEKGSIYLSFLWNPSEESILYVILAGGDTRSGETTASRLEKDFFTSLVMLL